MPHLGALRFQQTAVADVNPESLKGFGNSESKYVKYNGILSFGETLRRNKNIIYDAATAAHATYSERALVIAMAMVGPNMGAWDLWLVKMFAHSATLTYAS